MERGGLSGMCSADVRMCAFRIDMCASNAAAAGSNPNVNPEEFFGCRDCVERGAEFRAIPPTVEVVTGAVSAKFQRGYRCAQQAKQGAPGTHALELTKQLTELPLRCFLPRGPQSLRRRDATRYSMLPPVPADRCDRRKVPRREKAARRQAGRLTGVPG